MLLFIDEPRFNTQVRYGTSGGPTFSTDVLTFTSGVEQRNSNWMDSLGKWKIGGDSYSKSEMGWLISFFRERQGRLGGFRFKDWSDYEATITQGVLVAIEGDETAMQMVKRYTVGANTRERIITKPVLDTVQLYLDGVEVLAPEIDYATGRIAVNGTGYTWSGEFDVPVRFTEDTFSSIFEGYRRADGESMYTVSSLSVQEILIQEALPLEFTPIVGNVLGNVVVFPPAPTPVNPEPIPPTPGGISIDPGTGTPTTPPTTPTDPEEPPEPGEYDPSRTVTLSPRNAPTPLAVWGPWKLAQAMTGGDYEVVAFDDVVMIRGSNYMGGGLVVHLDPALLTWFSYGDSSYGADLGGAYYADGALLKTVSYGFGTVYHFTYDPDGVSHAKWTNVRVAPVGDPLEPTSNVSAMGIVGTVAYYSDQTVAREHDTGTYSPNGYKVDYVTNEVTDIPELPLSAGSAFAKAVFGTKIYFFGGTVPDDISIGSYFTTNTVWVFDTTTDTWSEEAPMPVDFAFGAATVVGGLIYVLPGISQANNPVTDAPANGAMLLTFNPSTGEWRYRTPVPYYYYDASSGGNVRFGGLTGPSGGTGHMVSMDYSSVTGKIYVIYSSVSIGGEALSISWVYDPSLDNINELVG